MTIEINPKNIMYAVISIVGIVAIFLLVQKNYFPEVIRTQGGAGIVTYGPVNSPTTNRATTPLREKELVEENVEDEPDNVVPVKTNRVSPAPTSTFYADFLKGVETLSPLLIMAITAYMAKNRKKIQSST